MRFPRFLHLFGLVALIFIATGAQSFADAISLIAEGRQALRDKNLALAVTKFTQACAADRPSNPEASLLLALTRLAAVVDQPETQRLLTKMGVPANGRNLFNWTANPGKKVPAALTSDDFEVWAKSTLLPVLDQSRGNLADITNPTFQTTLSEAESGLPDVIIDYGDVLFMRALATELKSSILFFDLFESKTRLADFEIWRKANLLTVQKILATYPKLLNLANVASLAPALANYSQAITFYGQAATFIRNRVDSTGRLFVIDPDFDAEEIQWRTRLTAVQSSIQAVVAFDTRTQVFAGAFQNSPVSLRTLLPAFSANHPAPGGFPDNTFHGVLPGMTEERVDEYFAKLGDYLDKQFHYRADPSLPTVTVTAPKANALFKVVDQAIEANVLFSGKAADNRGVTRVEVEIDGRSVVAQGTMNWTVNLGIEPSSTPYVAQVRSFDAQGNPSKPVFVTFHVRSYFTIALAAVPGGTFTPATKPGQVFQADKKVTFTATPKAGFLFDGWMITDASGQSTHAPAKLDYYPFSPGTITPIFRANPFMSHAGKFTGVFQENLFDPLTGDFLRTIVLGHYSFNVTKTGIVTGVMSYAGRTDTVKGQLNSQGEFFLSLRRPGLPNLLVSLDVDLESGDTFFVSISADEGVSWLSGATSPGIVPTGLAAKYTAYFSPIASAPHLPQGFGYLTATHDRHGNFRLVGAMADSTPFTVGTRVDGAGQLPFFAALDKRGSLFGGVLALDSDVSSVGNGMAGTLFWKHRSNPAALVFKTAFTADVTLIGERYFPPVGAQLIPPLLVNTPTAFNADEYDGASGFNSLASVGFKLGAGHRLLNIDTPAAKLVLTFAPGSGRFSGSFVDSAVIKKHTVNGVVVNGQGGFGFFHNAARNGPVTVSQ